MKFQHTTPMSVGSGPLGIGQLDQIFNGSAGVAALSQTWNVSAYNIKNPYSAVIIEISGLSAGSGLCAVVRVDNNGLQLPRFCAAFKSLPEVSGTYQAIIPANIIPGRSLGGTIYLSASATITQIVVYGATQQTPFPMQRSDGRAYPIGSQFNQANSSTAGNTTLVSIPNVSCRPMIYSLFIAPGVVSANASFQVQVTINGVTTAIMFGYAGPGLTPPFSMVWDQGLLCDIGTAVILTLAAGTWTLATLAVCTYDAMV